MSCSPRACGPLQRIFCSALALLLLLFGIARSSFAQAESASISGTIVDRQGGLVADAKVSIVNTDTNVTYDTKTNGAGVYNAPFLKPGHYRMLVAKQGFKQIDLRDLTLNVQDSVNRNFTLDVGGTSETIEVNGSAVNINTTDAAVSTVVDRQFVGNVPLNGRSFQDLILLTPGVLTNTPQNQDQVIGYSGDFSVNGQRTQSNSYMVDGVSANTNPGGGSYSSNSAGNVPSSTALGTTQSLVSIDALQEFRISSSSYSAESGRTPGGQISFVTRSGTDNFHGSAYDYLRNNYFDANNWFNDYYGVAEPALRQNDFGGTLGGPVSIPRVYDGKGKTFFFVSYEGLRLVQPQAALLQYVPSLSVRQQAPTVLQPILNAFPLPSKGGIDYGNGTAQFIQTESLPSQIDSTSVRIDQALSKMRLFFRFGDAPSSTATRNLSVYGPTDSNNRTYTFGATIQITTNISNDARIGYVASSTVNRYTLDSFGGAQPTNIAAALGAGTSATAGSVFQLSIGNAYTSLALEPSSGKMTQWNITDALSWVRSQHTLKFGFDYRHIASPFTGYSPLAYYDYTTEAQILSNSAAFAAGEILPSATPIYKEFSAFAQDEWRLSRGLTLSLGLRWEVNPAPGARNDNLPYTLQGSLSEPSTLALAPKGTQLWKTTWYNFAPRLGVAWMVHDAPGHQTVFRAGGGVYFDTGNEEGSRGYSGPGFTAINVVPNAPAPFPGGFNFTPSLTPPYSAVYYPYPHLQLPYTLEWSAAIEQGLGKAQTFTITYVGANGRRLLVENQLSVNSLNPNFSTIEQFANGSTSNYQALQTKFQRSVARGLQVLASYTWSHSLDYGSTATQIPIVRGNSDFDVRNNFTGAATWKIPNVARSRVGEAVLNNWGIDGHLIARSGFPVTLQGNELVDPSTGSIYDTGVNVVPGQPIYLHGTNCASVLQGMGDLQPGQGCPGGRAINPAAFSLPVGNDFGNAPRNFVRGFGATQVNLAVMREFPLHESLALQFRAEAFNILNHPNFGYIDPNLGDPTFGQATQTLNQSLTTVSNLYQTGGPRSMQFVLKLVF